MRPQTSNPDSDPKSGSQSDSKTDSKSGSQSGPEPQSISRLLTPDRTRARVSASSRKRALELGCEILAGPDDLNAREVLDALLARERLGSTALGDGVAIPHCRLHNCTKPMGVLITLESPVDYDAPDDGEVDLLFMLVVPETADDEHLQLLSVLAAILIKPENRRALREARDHLTLFETIQRLSLNP